MSFAKYCKAIAAKEWRTKGLWAADAYTEEKSLMR